MKSTGTPAQKKLPCMIRRFAFIAGSSLALTALGGCGSEPSLETSDAILWLQPAGPGAMAVSPPPGDSADTLRQALAEAEGDLRIYTQTLAATREAIEEAVVMVREQRENFDYALDRFETLMPLVETGALEPLAASQIQSAYISARASLAQAKFFLGQARRDFGSEEFRRRRLAELQNRVEELRQQLDTHQTVAPHETPTSEATEALDAATGPIVEAYFPGDGTTPSAGQRARVYWASAATDAPLAARVIPRGDGPLPPGKNSAAVLLKPMGSLPQALIDWQARGRAAFAVRVEILDQETVVMAAEPSPQPDQP